MPPKRETSDLTKWLIAGVAVIYIIVTAISDVNRAELLNENNDALKCIIQQLGEHRINNRSAHSTNASHHGYEYDVGPDNIPKEQIRLPKNICDEWLTRPEKETSGYFGR